MSSRLPFALAAIVVGVVVVIFDLLLMFFDGLIGRRQRRAARGPT